MEKRRVERFDLNLEAFVLVAGESSKKKPSRLMTRDVSMNGAYLLTPEPLPIGTRVKVDVIVSLGGIVPSETQKALIQASGSVLRTDSQGMAIRFDDNSRFSSYSESKQERT